MPAWENAETAQRRGAKLKTTDRLLTYIKSLLCEVFLSAGRSHLRNPQLLTGVPGISGTKYTSGRVTRGVRADVPVAATLLRFQSLDGAQMSGEVALSAPQSGAAGFGGSAEASARSTKGPRIRSSTSTTALATS